MIRSLAFVLSFRIALSGGRAVPDNAILRSERWRGFVVIFALACLDQDKALGRLLTYCNTFRVTWLQVKSTFGFGGMEIVDGRWSLHLDVKPVGRKRKHI